MFNLFKRKKPEPLQTEPPNYSHYFLDKKGDLIGGLKMAINGLEKDIVFYKWVEQGSCNCGVVVQALLNTTSSVTQCLFSEARLSINNVGKNEFTTWKEVVQKNCHLTGYPLHDVFKVLNNVGLKAQDIVHLEYLTNPAILEISGIDVSKNNYYNNRENLILYLKAWLKILNGKLKENRLSDKLLLEAKLLIATNSENYAEAAQIRDLLLQ